MEQHSGAIGAKKLAKLIAAISVTGAVTFGLNACGESDPPSSAPPSSAASDAKSAVSGDEYVELAKKITAEAKSGVIFAPSNDFTKGDQLKAPTEWLGPESSPPVPTDKSIAFVSCGAVACNEAMETGAKIAESIGFTTEVINLNGTGDVQNLNQSLSSALARKPDAIVTIAVAGTQVGPQLEEARKAGIVTISAADPTPTGGASQYSASADYPNGLSGELLGWSIVADTDGKADVVAIRDESFPAVIRKIDNLQEAVRGCGGCKISATTWQVTDALNSAKAANILSGVISSNPNMNVLALPYSIGIQSAVQAVKSSGRDIKIYADDADTVNLSTLRAGDSQTVSAVDPQLVMYQAVDQVVRGLNDAPYIEPAKLPYLAHLYSKETAPASGLGYFTRYFDYPAIYKKMWAAGAEN